MPLKPLKSVKHPALDEVSRQVTASPERVFAELADGWTYVGWVVGATHVRDVDDTWPQPGWLDALQRSTTVYLSSTAGSSYNITLLLTEYCSARQTLGSLAIICRSIT